MLSSVIRLPLVLYYSSLESKKKPFSQLKEAAWKGKYCCVPDCKNSSCREMERKLLGLPKLSFHSFPKDEAMVRKWIIKIKQDLGPDFKLNDSTRVCSAHFTPDDYFSTSD